jgi:hypothetical protein
MLICSGGKAILEPWKFPQKPKCRIEELIKIDDGGRKTKTDGIALQLELHGSYQIWVSVDPGGVDIT